MVVPWNARYAFPSQANKAVKMTPRIPPKNGGPFGPGGVIRLEFPAQGYVNTLNTTLEFDVTLSCPTDPGEGVARFQNNISSIFSRGRLLYGATPLEDLINYNVIVRNLTEWTCTNQSGTMDQTSVSEGIGGCTMGARVINTDHEHALVNTRQNYIQGFDGTKVAGVLRGAGWVPNQAGRDEASPGTYYQCTRRYSINLAFGLFTQDKLLPTKFMASQLAIEMTLANAASCIFTPYVPSGSGVAGMTYSVANVNLIPEILEFDASYDQMFLKGLREGGVPIKFSSWHTYNYSNMQTSSLNILIPERSRSVKSIFAVNRRTPDALTSDSGGLHFSTAGVLQQYQFRIGGRYFPAAPIQTSLSTGGSISNGGAEAYVELAKALNMVGDYRLSTGVNAMRWGIPYAPSDSTLALADADYTKDIIRFSSTGVPSILDPYDQNSATTGSGTFAMAVNLETSNGVEISGLNAEEQSDISLIAQYSSAQLAGFGIEVYTFYDAMVLCFNTRLCFAKTMYWNLFNKVCVLLING